MVDHVSLFLFPRLHARDFTQSNATPIKSNRPPNPNQLFGFEENPQHKAFKAETDDGQSLFVKINTTSEARAKLDREVQGLHSMVSEKSRMVHT